MECERRERSAGDGVSEPEDFRYEISSVIRDLAMTFPEASEGTSCVNRAFKSAGKNFVFLGEKDDLCILRLKLADGWAKIEFDPADPPAADQLRSWIDESFMLLAPKRLTRDR